MSIAVLPNPRKVTSSRYNYMMSMMNEEDGLAFLPHACKETTTWRLGSAIVFGHGIQQYACASDGMPKLDRPRYVISYRQKAYINRALRNAYDVLDLVSGHLNLSPPKVYLLGDTNLIVAEVDKFFVKSSVTNHLLYTLLRASVARAPHASPPDTKNVLRLLHDLRTTRTDTEDSSHLRISQDHPTKNLHKILSKTHESLRNDLDDWFVNPNNAGAPNWYGICSYRPLNTVGPKLEIDYMIDRGYARTQDGQFRGPGENYAHWSKLY